MTNTTNQTFPARFFDDIRPYDDSEIPAAMKRIAQSELFHQLAEFVFPEKTIEEVASILNEIKTTDEFQHRVMYHFNRSVIRRSIRHFTCKGLENISPDKAYMFVSNHRDIVLDSALLDKLLIDVGFDTTCEIAIGDNLLKLPWVHDFVRGNKSFTVERALHSVEMLRASKRMSEYIHYAINEKHENVWIAQRQGRAKNSNDLTQPAILKMMAMGGEGSVIERLMQLHIVPLAISYEYDPCDYLKAREYQLRRDVPYWKKGDGDDIESMLTGIRGYKGHINYVCAPCIDKWLLTVDEDMPKNKLFDTIAAHIDTEIHRNYRLYPCNYIALDLIQDTRLYTDEYTPEELQAFEEYMETQLAKIEIDNKDDKFLRLCMLSQYAYPAKNYMAARDGNGRFKSWFNHLPFVK